MRNAFRMAGAGLVLTSEANVVLPHASRELAVGTDARETATVLDILAHSQEELTGLDRVRKSFAASSDGSTLLAASAAIVRRPVTPGGTHSVTKSTNMHPRTTRVTMASICMARSCDAAEDPLLGFLYDAGDRRVADLAFRRDGVEAFSDVLELA